MGFFSDVRQAFNQGRKKAHTEAEAAREKRTSPKKRLEILGVESTKLTLQVCAEEPYLSMYVGQIRVYTESLDGICTASGKVVTLEFRDSMTTKIAKENFSNL